MYNANIYPLLKDVDNLNEPSHSMVLYDNVVYGNLVKYRFIENGLKKKEHSICITHGDVTVIENEIASLGIDVDYFKRKNLLHIYQIENILERSDGLESGYYDLLKTVTKDSKPPYRFIGCVIPNVSTEKGIQAELVLERLFHSNFSKYQSSLLCTYDVNGIERSKRPIWISHLLKNHHNMIYATEPANAVTFNTDLLNMFQD